MPSLKETELYPPVKAFLEGQGYQVKGEVEGCDVVALKEGQDPLVVELKTSFTLPLVFQGLKRQSMTDLVYLAVATPEKGQGSTLWRRHRRDILKLCRQLGLGLLVVSRPGREDAWVEAHLDPLPYRPKKNKRRSGRLLKEFQHRVGDPNSGGSSKRALVTAYRQDALRCACHLQSQGPAKLAELRAATGVARAAGILQRDVYGWFERVARGTYAVSPKGEEALKTYADVVAALGKS